MVSFVVQELLSLITPGISTPGALTWCVCGTHQGLLLAPPQLGSGPSGRPLGQRLHGPPVGGRRRIQQGAHTRQDTGVPASALDEHRAWSCSRFCRGRDVRCQASSFISTFSTVPTQKMGNGGHVIHFRAATFNLARVSDPLGKDEGEVHPRRSLCQRPRSFYG